MATSYLSMMDFIPFRSVFYLPNFFVFPINSETMTNLVLRGVSRKIDQLVA